MLQIFIDNKEIDFSDDIAIEMNITNPIFTEDGFLESYSYSFNIPKTPKNNFLRFTKKKKLKAIIQYGSVIFVKGYAIFNSDNQGQMSINIIDESINFKQKLELINFDQIELGKIQIYNESDDPITKITKWKNHMNQVMLIDSNTEGSHKFPPIQTMGYDFSFKENDYDGINTIHNTNNNIVNAYISNTIDINQGVPISFQNTKKHWYNTVSPCLRIEWLFTQICEFFGITEIEGDLKDIQEFKEMVNFCNYVLDKNIALNLTENINVYGSVIDLKKHTPNASTILLFNLLHEVFGAFFYINDSKIYARTLRKSINSEPIDFSKFCTDGFQRNIQDDISNESSYDLPDGPNKFIYDIPIISLITDYIRINPYKSRSIHELVGVEKNVKTLSHLPMISNYRYNWYYTNFTDFSNDYNGSNIIQHHLEGTVSTFFYCVEELVSDEYADLNKEKSTRFNIGLVRGIRDVYRTLFDVNGEIIGNTILPHRFCTNFKTTPVQTNSTPPIPVYSFGNASVYISGDQNTWDYYWRDFYQYTENSIEIQKTLFLPVNEIMNILTWEKPKHYISQRNLSFIGMVKNIKFTLRKSTISSSEITYVVPSSLENGDFNNDYNTDFVK